MSAFLIFALIIGAVLALGGGTIFKAHWHYLGHPSGVHHCARCPIHYTTCRHEEE